MSALAPTKPTGRDKLEASSLRLDQLEGMGDVDVKSVILHVLGVLNLEIRDAITDIKVKRTIGGASTVTVEMADSSNEILRTVRFKTKTDIKIDGLWFRNVQLAKVRRTLSATFEDREIAVLRTYNKKKIANRADVTRAEFILSLIKEVKEFKIKWFIPQLHKVQPVEESTDLTGGGTDQAGAAATATKPGFPSYTRGGKQHPGAQPTMTAKGVPLTQAQLHNAAIILDVGLSLAVRRKVLVCALMTAIQESTLHNLEGGDRDSVGLFQQRSNWGSFAERHDPATAARLFYVGYDNNGAIQADKDDPTRPYWDLCQAVQGSAFPTAYAKWFTEANRMVVEYGITGGDNEAATATEDTSRTTSDYQYYRGKPSTDGSGTWKPEDSWACIQRLAEEVNWRAFFVSGTFYYITDADLFKSKPLMTIDEEVEGVNGIDFDYDTGKKNATITVDCVMNRWFAPPGSVVKVDNMGTINGRWLVNTVERSLFQKTGTITLKKPRPTLDEPFQDPIDQQAGGGADSNIPGTSTGQTPVTRGGIIMPLTTKPPGSSEFWIRDAEGAPDAMGVRWHAALDWMAPAGTPIFAPVAGTIVEIKQSSGTSGQIFGGVVKIRDDITNEVYVFRHSVPGGALREGARVQAGTILAGVSPWKDNPSSTHTHIEIWKTLSGGYFVPNMLDPFDVFGLG